MAMSNDPFYLIKRSHLPEVIQKTTQVTDLLQREKGMSVLDAVKRVGISRSAFYKYKDIVRPFHSAMSGQIVTLALTLQHETGVLSEVLNFLATLRGNILTINQSLPLQGLATVILSIETRDMVDDLDAILEAVRQVHGVEQAMIVGQG